MSTLNKDQSDYWNGEVGQRWATHHRALDTAFAPFTEALFARAALAPGARVLDIGCGAGDTALIAARQVGSDGHITAADLSEPLLAVGRERAAREAPGAAPIEWLRADAQDHAFGTRFDHALSRFGVMFFEDSAAAFANIRHALEPDGRLTFLCWRSMAENDWVMVPRAVVLPLLPEVEPPQPGAPGPFRFAAPDTALPILEAAAFRAIECEPVNRAMRLGDTPEAAASFAATRGPIARLLRECDPALQEDALKSITDLFADRFGSGPVSLGAACWLISART
ncbi:type 11 methyltransferase [Methylorubrum populi]|uniref:Type 11 methyltransferase n=1 Tax=Methylorubrum populi TaxID=223967 RepID=A0A160PBI5_9HYPH|nr:class I SAM-dependent methyltransferase [Methylorubrum populi]BAU89674.1 type 11 methyltransferase [Methylorubrum populi]